MFYTVDRAGSLSALQTITLDVNGLPDLPYWTMPGYFSEDDLRKHAQELFPEGMTRHGWYYLKQRHTYGAQPHFTHETSCFTDMNFEYVRRISFPNLPSRFRSIFAWETLEEAQKFRREFNCETAAVYEVDGTTFFRADMSWLLLGTQNVTGSLLAHKYWSGLASPNPCWEIICEAPVTIGKRVL